MSILKKVLIVILVLALAAGGASGALVYLKKANQQEVMVVSVGSIASDYYMQSTNLEGQIATSVSQNITVDSDVIIENVYVNKGDSVSKGDTLVTYDTTLVEMELNIAKLKKQQQEQDLKTAEARLESLKNGGPLVEESTTTSTGSSLNNSDLNTSSTMSDSDMASISEAAGGNYLAFVAYPLLAAAFDDGSSFDGGDGGTDGSEDFGDGSSGTEEPTTPEEGAGTEVIDEVTPTPAEEISPTETPEATPTPVPDEIADDDFSSGEVVLYPPEDQQEGNPDISDGQDTFYLKLDGDSEPFAGSGTEEDPYVFLCSSAKGKVTVTGAFFNKMAGYNADGTELLHEGGYWFRLEFHQNDTISDYQNLQASCTGYYLINGGILEQPVDIHAEIEYTLEEATKYEDDSLSDMIDEGGLQGGSSSSAAAPYTREEAIRLQENKVTSLKLDITESEINIGKLETKANKKASYSKLDGTVSYVGDALTKTTDGSAFISIKSAEGYYVKGTVGEMMLDQVKEGTVLNCTSYNSAVGSFEAEVVDVSEYPVTADNYYGDGNPNVSYYSFSAEIPDKSLKVTDQDWLTITLQSNLPTEGSIVLDKAFVRTENGESYVYKDENGILKKQILSVGGNVNGGYSVLVKSGITTEDKIAFPYGKTAQEGAKTREVTLDELYGY